MKKKGIKGGVAALIIGSIIFFATGNLGQQEKPNNSGFKNAQLEQAMREVGWHKYDSWCVYFAKLCWHVAITNDTVNDLAMKLITGNSQSTLANFQHDKSGWFEVTNYAQPAAIVIWQEIKDSVGMWSGHAGIVIKDTLNGFKTIEGNTNTNGSSNGYEVAMHYKKYNWHTMNGLRLRGFIRFKVLKP